MKNLYMGLLLLFFSFPARAAPPEPSFTFKVKHDHLWKDGEGQLVIAENSIVYESEGHEDHSREWTYTDVQDLRIESAQKIRILSYEDSWKLNKDRDFEFELVEGEVTPEVVRFLRERLPTPLVSAVFTPPEGKVYYSLPVKHQHALAGGCEGHLTFADDAVYFISTRAEHSRMWLISDIESIGRMSRFNFRVTAREDSILGSERNFQFQLKRPMDEEAYQLLWSNIYEPDSWLARYAAESNAKPDQSRQSGRLE